MPGSSFFSPMRRQTGRRRGWWSRWTAATALIAVAIVAIVGFVVVISQGGPDGQTVLDRLLADPSGYLGRRIALRGRAVRVIRAPSPRTDAPASGFLIAGGSAAERSVLVLAPVPRPQVAPLTVVAVRGTVVRLPALSLARALRRGRGDPLVARYAGRPVIRASHVNPIAGAAGF